MDEDLLFKVLRTMLWTKMMHKVTCNHARLIINQVSMIHTVQQLGQ